MKKSKLIENFGKVFGIKDYQKAGKKVFIACLFVIWLFFCPLFTALLSSIFLFLAGVIVAQPGDLSDAEILPYEYFNNFVYIVGLIYFFYLSKTIFKNKYLIIRISLFALLLILEYYFKTSYVGSMFLMKILMKYPPLFTTLFLVASISVFLVMLYNFIFKILLGKSKFVKIFFLAWNIPLFFGLKLNPLYAPWDTFSPKWFVFIPHFLVTIFFFYILSLNKLNLINRLVSTLVFFTLFAFWKWLPLSFFNLSW